jgi:hypothetical protein
MQVPASRFAAAAYRAFMNHRMLPALLLLGFATGASAIFDDGQRPTVDEAHGFLGGTFQRYSVGYAGQHAGRASLARIAVYGGEGCSSELAPGRGKRAMKVDWSAVSAVEQLEGNAVELRGGGARGNVRVFFPNERAARSAANAFEVLRSACVPPSLTASDMRS